MRIWTGFVCFVLIGIQGCVTVNPASVPGVELDDAFAEEVKDIVTRIYTVHDVGGEEIQEHGFGLIVGSNVDDKKLFVITASHVVEPEDIVSPTGEPIDTAISLAYYCCSKKMYPVTRELGTKAQQALLNKNDLALLSVKFPSSLYGKLRADVLSSEYPSRATQVWYIGALNTPDGDDWYIPTTSGRVNRAPTKEVPEFILDGMDAKEGTSGGPLVTKSGIVGIVTTRVTERNVLALSINWIKTVIREQMGESWQLVDRQRLPLRKPGHWL